MEKIMTKYMNEDEVDVLVNAVLPRFIVEVDFIKTNGEKRHMKCTKDHKFIDARLENKYPDGVPAVTRHKVPNPDVVSVWDLEKDDWRAFRKDSVTNYAIVP